MQELATYLKSHGQNITEPRRLVFTALQHSDPLSMAELEKRCPSIDRSSVYRTVQLFEQMGVVQRLNIGWKYKLELSDAFQKHHHHMTCRVCAKHLPMTGDAELEKQLQQIAQHSGFLMKDHQIEIQGICKDCH